MVEQEKSGKQDRASDKERIGLVRDIDDNNYPAFIKDNKKAVLVVGTSWCHFCAEYKPVVSRLAKALPEVSFGQVVLDRPHRTGVKRDYGTLLGKGVPLTLVFEEGRNTGFFYGANTFEEVLDVLRKKHLVQKRPNFFKRLVNRFRNYPGKS